ncbi:hypothetical protein [Desulfofundulus thermosubterraneus]|uniref:Uncharacterized protein n=1 Tax=Desulfofundulus thermosubterraneus DSM 16057 TaxID=1121432 RepID=A0A1M6GQ01_9FIRM|nr:hypothetical protein [Desulfofundulus thermosubterraneus]SHJ11976.1 hypothetical protein SAMN02745219_01782 [Desulfofundulus thermosubterraneus DSM 16057]
MALLLYEIKAGTPLGRVLVVFLNLYLHSEYAAGNKRGNLKNIPIKVLAEAAALQQGIGRPSPPARYPVAPAGGRHRPNQHGSFRFCFQAGPAHTSRRFSRQART